jgi:hypothetical protein
MRTAFFGVVLVVASGFAFPAEAQQVPTPASVESLRAALQKSPQSSLTIPAFPWVAPRSTRLGIFTLVPPRGRGEMVRVMVPIGDLVSRATHGVSNARRHRAERHAREEVTQALRDFEAGRIGK